MAQNPAAPNRTPRRTSDAEPPPKPNAAAAERVAADILAGGKGVGFFEAGNFYPDFILWLLMGDHQYITFIDPKGIRQLGPNDPKILFSQTIKTIEAQLGDPNVILDAYIVSGTRRRELASWGQTDEQFRDRHVLFRHDDPMYIQTMLETIPTGKSSALAGSGAHN